MNPPALLEEMGFLQKSKSYFLEPTSKISIFNVYTLILNGFLLRPRIECWWWNRTSPSKDRTYPCWWWRRWWGLSSFESKVANRKIDRPNGTCLVEGPRSAISHLHSISGWMLYGSTIWLPLCGYMRSTIMESFKNKKWEKASKQTHQRWKSIPRWCGCEQLIYLQRS